MKYRLQNVMVSVVTMLLVVAMCCGMVSAAPVIQFSDVTREHWGYETIMDMTEAGLFKGTTEPVNGVGAFSPDKVMTRAEFVTVAVRAIYPTEASKIQNDSEQWWKGYYELAVKKGILKRTELDKGDLSKSMSRQEMAMVMVRCVEKNGEKQEKRVDTSRIADYSQIGSYYRSYVLDCFSFGLLCGIDEKGTFAPTKSLTRAEGATVLCRLVDHEKRVEVFSAETNGQGDTAQLPGGKKPEDYTWEENEALSEAEKAAFYESFAGVSDFDTWLTQAQANAKLPWENGSKKPKDYTWEEYEALSGFLQDAFFESFESVEAFEKWLEANQPE